MTLEKTPVDSASTKLWYSNRAAWAASIIAAAVAFYHYVRTVHPGVGPALFLDSVEYQTAVAVMGISHPPGYPLYLFLGKLFSYIPWGERLAHFGDNPAWRLNMMSVVFSSITVLLMGRLIYRLTRSGVITLFGALTLAGAVRFWYQASYTELYPVYTTMVVATFLLLMAWMETRKPWLYYASAAVYALSFGVNAPAIVLLPAWLWAVLVTDHRMLTRPKSFGRTAVIVILAASQYLYIPIRALVAGPPIICNYCPQTWSELPAFLSGQEWWGISFGLDRQFWLQRWADSGYQLMLQFWPVGVMLGGIGLWDMLKNRWRQGGTFLLGLAGTWYFVVSYDVVDWSDFMTPVYVLFVPLIAVGMAVVWQWLAEKAANWQQPVYAALLVVMLVSPVVFFTAVFRNNAPIVNQSGNMIWHWWARDFLKQMEPDAWVLTPMTATDGFVPSWMLHYVALTEGRPDVQMVYTPGLDTPGPAPDYHRWEDAEPELAQHPVYAIERNDERMIRYVLLPILREDGSTLGYQVVGERDGETVTRWVSDARWAEIEPLLVFP